MVDHLEPVVAWKNLPITGTDYCALWHTAEGWLLKGAVVGILEDAQCWQTTKSIVIRTGSPTESNWSAQSEKKRRHST
jgi:hypothetical protein